MIKIQYSNHALERLRQRGITKEEIIQAIRDGTKSDAEGGLRRAEYSHRGNFLIVIYKVKDIDEVEIITAYRR